MKIIKKTGKLIFTVSLCLYAICLINGVTFFDYTATSDGGTLSVVGYTVDITGSTAASFWDIYTRVERKAAEILPKQVSAAVDWIAQKLPFDE